MNRFLLGSAFLNNLFKNSAKSNADIERNKRIFYLSLILIGMLMGKFPIADEALAQVWICRKCKARNKAGATKCRKCGSPYLRPKHREVKAKSGK